MVYKKDPSMQKGLKLSNINKLWQNLSMSADRIVGRIEKDCLKSMHIQKS